MMQTPCFFCGGAAHPATGCAYSETFIVCWRCTTESWKELLAHINGKGGRSGLYFYEHAAPKMPAAGAVAPGIGNDPP